MILTLTMFSTPANAQDLGWHTGGVVQSGSAYDDAVTCPAGTTPISGGAVLDPEGPPRTKLVGTRAVGPLWTGEWSLMEGAEANPKIATATASALCAAPSLLSCVQHVTLDTPNMPVTDLDQTLACPAGTYLVGGGFSLLGDHDGVIVRAAAPSGLLWPTGYRVVAEAFDPPQQYDWGVHIDAFCAEPAVMGTIGLHDDQFTLSQTWTGDANPTIYALVGTGHSGPLPEACGMPLVGGVAAFPPNSVAGVGWDPAGDWTARVHAFPNAADPTSSVAKDRALCTSNLTTFEKDLAACEPSEPPERFDPFDLPVPSIGGEVLIGVIEGAGGIIIVPGDGPVPVDPGYLTFDEVAAAVPVVILPVEARQQAAVIDAITSALDEEGTAWSSSSELSRTPGLPGVTVVAPRSEQAAVDWLRDHRSAFASHPGVVLLVLDEAGAALASTARW
ncbi:MAG: hypothetical protein R3F59_30715 [Myxococcota bacterium]